jgi:Mn2+/Fe2+ NRAMP family transporter
MVEQLMNIISEYHLIIMIVMLLLLMLASLRKVRNNKLLLILIATLTGSIIYELVMDEPASNLPQRIDQFFNHPGPVENTNPHYYSSPEKHYKLLSE